MFGAVVSRALFVAALVRASPVANTTASAADNAPTAGANTTEPCAAAALVQADKNGNGIMPAELAYNCYTSVPVNTEGDAQLIDEIKLFLQWNTDTQRFKDLPDWYDNESFDLLAALDDIKNGVNNGSYQSEYDVQQAISGLFYQTGDNHNVWLSDIATIFRFQSGVRLVSVTSGSGPPEVYNYQDLVFLYNGQYNFSASSITHIDGENVQTYLTKVGKQLTYHDAHARYNGLFPDQAKTSLGNGAMLGIFTNGNYRAPNNTYTYSNGTIRTVPNIAKAAGNLTGVTDGKSFLAKLLSGNMTAPPSEPEETTRPTETPGSTLSAVSTPTIMATPTPAPGYPEAVILHPGNAIGGYYLNGSENQDVAVLSVPTFEPQYSDPDLEGDAIRAFQIVAREFIAKAAADGKKKMIVDLRANGGGDTFLGFDLFKLFFPQMTPYQATRRRAHEAYHQLVDLATYVGDTLASEGKDLLNPIYGRDINEFYYKIYSVTPNDTEFASPAEFYGPHANFHDEFTSLRGWNLSSTRAGFSTNNSVAGYGAPLASNSTPFDAPNILLLQDGSCSSTCAIFSELMYSQTGVQTLAMGGLPTDSIPMQKVGGTKGWLTWSLSSLAHFTQLAYASANETTLRSWKGTELEAMNQSTVIFERVDAFQVNAADGIRKGDATETPLQFVFEAAECRLWYTPRMIFEPAAVWEAAANTKWGNGTCDAGPGWGSAEGNGTSYVPPTSSGAVRLESGLLMTFAAVMTIVVLL